jgi:hypothetical protein
MAIRNTTHVLKNSDIVNRPLPSSLLKGEPIVNTADGIMYFSGFTTSTNEWTPAGTGTTANFFEVGSNLYDLRLRNQITKYQGQTGSGLVGKFLSGTTSGFVLADISDIAASVDSYTTGATWSPNVLTIELNNGKPSVPVTIDSFTALTINGNLNVTGTEVVNNLTITGTGLYNTTATGTNSLEIVNYGSLTAFSQTNDVYVTGSTLTQATDNTDSQSSLLLYHGTPIGGSYTIDTENTYTTGGTWNSGTTAIDFTRNDGVTYSVSLSNIDVNDTYVTGGTNTAATDNTSTASIGLLYNRDIVPGTYSLPYTDVYTTGGTYNSGTEALDFTRNDGTIYSVSLSGIDINDTFVTGFTYNPSSNTFTISQNEGQPDLTASINSVSGLTVNGDLNVTGTELVNNLTITGTGLYNTTATGSNSLEIVNYGSLTAFSQTNDVYVTGSTLTPATNNTDSQSSLLLYHGIPIGSPYTIDTENTFTTGGTYNSGTEALDFTRNDGVVYSVSLSGIDINDTYVTGFTYSPTTNTFTISQNEGQPDLVASINTVSGLSFSNLTQGRVVYVGPGGLLTDESTFTYNDGTNTLSVDNIDAAGNVVIQGDLTVLGAAISAFTSNLYVEDPNITLNYNPTGSTIATSVNAGFTIQDGNGVSGGSVNFDIVRMQNLTGLTGTEVPSVTEYTALTGYPNRGWVTQLNDIVIRSTDPTDDGSFNGVRVLAEFDVLDGGSY